MRNNNRVGASAHAAGLGLLILLAAAAVVEAQVDRSLRILYVGRPGSEREEDFAAFLKKHFDIVQTGNLETFKEADARGFDVTLLDWDTISREMPKPTFSEGFSRPVMTLGVPGAMIFAQTGRFKTGYM